MINGEGAEEKLSSAVTSPCDPPCDRESDGGDVLSNYSSCDAESDFDRYCSASSAMGTPSFRSSSSFHDSEFGSLKSFKLGGENTSFKNFGEKKALSGFRDRVTEFYSDEKDNGVLSLNRRREGFFVSGVDLMGNFDFDDSWGNEGLKENENENVGINHVNSKRILGEFGEINKGDDEGEKSGIGKDESRRLEDAGEEYMSRHEHSEGEDSMFGCGSDDESNMNPYYRNNLQFKGEESEKNENPLVMNSAVAFGSNDWDDFVQESRETIIGSLVQDEIQGGGPIGSSSFTTVSSVTYRNVVLEEEQKEVRNAPGNLAEINVKTLSTNSSNHVKLDARVEDVKGVRVSSNQVSDIDELVEFLGCSPGYNIFEMSKDTPSDEARANKDLKNLEIESEMKIQDTSTRKVISNLHDIVLKNKDLEKTNIESGPISESVLDRHHLLPVKGKEDREVKLLEDNSSVVLSSLADTNTRAATQKNYAFSFDQIEDHFVPVKTRDLELNDFCDEIVNDMKDILLDSGESPGSGFTHSTMIHQSQFPRPSRDGGSSASTSDKGQSHRIDSVEVVGTKQKEGDVSFGERLVGVKKYTVYKIRVYSGENHWEIERRYRDFSTLYHRLKKLFTDHGWTLPSPWSCVEKESKKLFGNASPTVIADRSVLIQECLQSVINRKFSSNSLNALTCFLSPSEEVPDCTASDTSAPQSPLGKTISLVVQKRHFKSMKQMLDEQHYRCAGCHRNFDDGITRVQEFVQALGWGKPRLCEYSSQLFCSSCHNNETAILPARVLHYWDFTLYPVSQMAKSYLDSIYDQPMLCVSAINPFLFSKVPTLQHVANIRNRIRTMLPYVRCPFRGSIYKGLGSRRYILDSNDFFALKDLIDLSKGVFSALPVMVETVSRKIEEHITEQCLVCYDIGIQCSARQACNDPLSLIFPFQEGEVKKCKSCELVFHKKCFKKMANCPCGAHFKQEKVKQSVDHSLGSNLNLVGGTVAEPRTGLLAGLFSKVMPQKSHIFKKQEPKGDDNVILMGSLPNTPL
ncbi:hypothetical protein ACJIZ3_020877 [Penstemon smallii]|uniref:PX domain-containing protein n=1 Tax=Penstemon smallii TaxID=265156 RepID=A0ABD3SKP8_9LAMI